MDHIYFSIIVVLTLSVGHIKGQESVLNITKTTSITSIKPKTHFSFQTQGFNSSDVRSGPILLIDKKTIFISNLNYDGSKIGARFWTGTGIPSAKGTLVPDEDNLNTTLHAYQSQNIYLKLPGNLTTDKIDYLALWSIERNSSISYVILYPNGSDEVRRNIPEALGFHQITRDNKTIFRVPKCCKLNEFYRSGCQPANNEVKIEYNVFMSNSTHIDPAKLMTDIEFIPYEYNLKCVGNDYRRTLLNETFTTFGLLYNSSLIFGDEFDRGILSHGQFCMEEFGGERTGFLICILVPNSTAASLPNLYFPFLVISTFCFFLSALCYLVILKAKDVHKKCFIGYSSSMTVTFLFLIFLQKLNSACDFIGSVFVFSTLCSFVWLTCLCIDLVFIVKSYKKFSDETRIYYYIGFSLIIPVIILSASLSPDGVPDVPISFVKRYSDPSDICSFEGTNIAIFFTPIGILMLVSLIALVYTSYIINTHNDTRDYDWVRNKSNYKFMLRSCFVIWTTTCIWVIAALVNILEMTSVLEFAIHLIEASQGIFVAFVFVLNKYTRREILRVLKKDKYKREQELQYGQLLERLNQPREAEGRADNEHG